MIDRVVPLPAEPAFVWHTALQQRLVAFCKDVKFAGVNVLAHLKVTDENTTIITAESWQEDNGCMVGGIARVYTELPVVDLTLSYIYGVVGNDQVTFDRKKLTLDVMGESHTVYKGGGQAGHGQGEGLARVRVNLLSGAIQEIESLPRVREEGDMPPPYYSVPSRPAGLDESSFRATISDEALAYPSFDQTIYVPARPGRSGDQEIFGTSAIHGDLWFPHNDTRERVWFEQLRNGMCRPGIGFMHNDGTLPKFDDPRYDRLVQRGADFHPNSKGFEQQAWFKPSGWDWGATTSQGSAWKGWDNQHYGLLPILQAWWLYDDPGLDLILRLERESWLRSNPVTTERGTVTDQEAARTQGRIMQAGACLFWHAKEEEDRLRILAHIEALIQLHKAEPEVAVRSNGRVAPWEHGERVNGYAALLSLPLKDETRDWVVYRATRTCVHLLGWAVDFGEGWGWSYEVYPSTGLPTARDQSITHWNLTSMTLLERVQATADLTSAQAVKLAQIQAYWKEPEYTPGRRIPEVFEWLI